MKGYLQQRQKTKRIQQPILLLRCFVIANICRKPLLTKFFLFQLLFLNKKS